MPTWTSFASYANSIDRLKADIGPVNQRRITRMMAEEAEDLAKSAAASAVGGDLQHSGWGVPIVLRRRRVGDTGHMISPTRSSAGPWTEIEHGRHADGGVGRFQGPGVNARTGLTNRTRTGNISRRRSRRAVRWNGMTRARGAASRAVSQIEQRTPQIAERELRRILRGHVDVT